MNTKNVDKITELNILSKWVLLVFLKALALNSYVYPNYTALGLNLW